MQQSAWAKPEPSPPCRPPSDPTANTRGRSFRPNASCSRCTAAGSTQSGQPRISNRRGLLAALDERSWQRPRQAARRFTGRRVGAACGASKDPSRVSISTTRCRSAACSLESAGNDAMYGLSPSAFVTGKSGSDDIERHFGVEERHHPIDVGSHLFLGKKLVHGLNVGGGISRWIAEKCAAHTEKPADPLTDFSPPAIAVGHTAGELPRGDGQNATGMDEGVLDRSFADPRIVDQRVAVAEILQQRIEDDVVALGTIPLADLLHAQVKNDRAREKRNVGDEDPGLPARRCQPERRSEKRDTRRSR